MKLMTWNIQWGRGADGRVDLDRIVAHAKRFSEFDVLCLQEVSCGYPELGGNDGNDQFVEIAKRLPDYAAVPGIATDAPDASGKRRGFGNMILSRYPVMQVFRHLLPWPSDPGKKSMQRIALEATLDTPLGLLRVTTTHLEYYSPKQRRAQIERLRELQRDGAAQARTACVAKPEEGPFFYPPRGLASIVTGDFNLLPDAADKALLESPIDTDTPSYRDAWRLAHPGTAHEPTVGLYDKVQWPGPPFTFDFIFVSEDLAPRVTAVKVDTTSDASDHQPMLVELA
jgi:endonuclease/exonuclease/phosphatase family metal-dependent hydrolase